MNYVLKSLVQLLPQLYVAFGMTTVYAPFQTRS